MRATQETKPEAGKVYSLNFSTGKLEPITAAGLLPVGAVVTYEDRANPKKRFVVTAAAFDAYGNGQRCICEDGHTTTVSRSAINGPGGWHDTGEVLNAEEIAAFRAGAQAEGERIKAEETAATQAQAQSNAQSRAQWAKTYAHLETVKPGTYASAKLGAANIRAELKRAFPGVKFSVRSETFSGGDSIDIAWELGPTTEVVKAITDKYQEGHFNGMEDIYETDRNHIWPQIYGGAKYVHEQRHTRSGEDVVAAALCVRWGLEIPADRSWWRIHRADDNRGHDVGVIARQIIMAQSYPIGAVITGIEATGETAGQWHEIIRATFTAPSAPATVAPVAVQVGGSADISVSHNAAKNGIEIRFATKPAADVLADLKSRGWRWSRFSGCWYATATQASADYAAKIANMADDERRTLLAKLQNNTPDHFDMQVEDNMRAACGC